MLGDTIRVAGTRADMKVSRTGTVAKRDLRFGNTEYLTAYGETLLLVYTDGTTDHPATTITLLNRNIEPGLFDLDKHGRMTT